MEIRVRGFHDFAQLPLTPTLSPQAGRGGRGFLTLDVMAGLVPAIPLREALRSPDRDHRDEPGDDN
jgi:hypothetical protein